MRAAVQNPRAMQRESSNPGAGETITLVTDGSGARLDAWLAAKCAPALSRSRIKALLEEGNVLAGGAVPQPKAKLPQGVTVEIRIPPPAKAEPDAQDIPMDVLYEDGSVIVINKPPGMVVHPAPGHGAGTLVNALLFHCGDLKGVGGVERPGIVHRLDMDTSGILVAAKDEQSLNSLMEQFRSRTTEKRYAALVHGKPSSLSGTVSSLIGRHPRDRKKMAVDPPGGGKEAITHWKVDRFLGKTTLLGVKIDTGRTHQIRVHLSHLGMPIVGDQTYGKPQLDKMIENCPSRQMLHAAEFSFIHPVSGKRMHFEAPLPADFMEVLKHA